MTKLKIYGMDASQPFRSVKWLLLMKDIEFEHIVILPGSSREGGSKHPDYRAKCVAHTVPLLEEEDGFLVWESHAIMVYLCEKYGWTDLYPTDLKERALVNQWLHWHHSNTRRATIALFAPVIRKDMKLPEVFVKNDTNITKRALSILNKTLDGKKFLIGDNPTIADIALYGDLGQFSKKHLNLFDFSKYPVVQQWIERMQTLPQYEEAHKVINSLKRLFPDSNL